MKKDVNDLKQLVMSLMQNDKSVDVLGDNTHLIKRLYKNLDELPEENQPLIVNPVEKNVIEPIQESEEIEESLSLEKREIDFIKKALYKHEGKRKGAANELGISERTLYRKIKEYNIE